MSVFCEQRGYGNKDNVRFCRIKLLIYYERKTIKEDIYSRDAYQVTGDGRRKFIKCLCSAKDQSGNNYIIVKVYIVMRNA